jgi:hypothetical protein
MEMFSTGRIVYWMPVLPMITKSNNECLPTISSLGTFPLSILDSLPLTSYHCYCACCCCSIALSIPRSIGKGCPILRMGESRQHKTNPKPEHTLNVSSRRRKKTLTKSPSDYDPSHHPPYSDGSTRSTAPSKPPTTPQTPQTARD